MDAGTVNIFEIGNLLRQQFEFLFPKMAGLKLQESPGSHVLPSDSWSLMISTSGDYQLSFLMCAAWEVWRTTARNMAHGREISQENVLIYGAELFNVLCGRVISAINTKYRYSACFSVPKILQGSYSAPAGFDYYCNCGPVKLSVAHRPFPCDCQGLSDRPNG